MLRIAPPTPGCWPTMSEPAALDGQAVLEIPRLAIGKAERRVRLYAVQSVCRGRSAQILKPPARQDIDPRLHRP